MNSLGLSFYVSKMCSMYSRRGHVFILNNRKIKQFLDKLIKPCKEIFSGAGRLYVLLWFILKNVHTKKGHKGFFCQEFIFPNLHGVH
jgi:hypothetical protein